MPERMWSVATGISLESTVPTRRAFLSAGLVLTAAPALAHHGFTGRYDTDMPIFLSGVVTAASFAPPHPVLTIQVAPLSAAPVIDPLPTEMTGRLLSRAVDAGELRAIEFAPVRDFFDLAGRVQLGDTVEIIALRNCLPPRQLRSQWLRLADGSVIQRQGRLSYMQRGCAA